MLEKKYNHIEVEKNKYNNWKDKGYTVRMYEEKQ